MSTQKTTEETIIESLESVKKIMIDHIADIKGRIELMNLTLQPFEEYLNSIPKDQMDFIYGKSFAVRTLVDEIKAIHTLT